MAGEEEGRLRDTLEDELRFWFEQVDAGCDAEPCCIACGCTNDRPCPGGCIWAGPNLCSRCV